jgi:hypothetical protein
MRKQKLFRRWVVVALTIFMAALSAKATSWPLAIPKGSSVVVKIPTRFWQVGKYDAVSGSGQRIYFIDMEMLFSSPDWESSGFPYCGEFTLTKISEFRPFYKLRYTDIELRNNGIYLKLRFNADVKDLNGEFQKVVATGNWRQFEASEEFRDNVLTPQGNRIFTGPLAQLPATLKLSLFNTVCDGQNTLGTETYKDKSYVAVALSSDGNVYNSLKLNEAARVAQVVNGRLLSEIKLYGKIAGLVGIEGVKFAVGIAYKDFVNESVPHIDNLEIYVPLNLSTKFADADITSQQMIDGSIVVLNGNRIQVSLAGSI